MRKLIAVLILVSCTDDSPPTYYPDGSYIIRDASTPRDIAAIVDATDSSSPDVLGFECPLGPIPVRIDTEPCEREDLSPGRRVIWCDKGFFRRGPCEPCVLEVCDSEDNDCDGILDEGFYACDTACGPGTGVCSDGSIVGCDAPPALPEACDLIDNDCDGTVDENLSRACYTGPVGTEGVGVCSPGTQICQDGLWGSVTASGWVESSCEPQTHPSPEVCDGADNNCDGTVDYGNPIQDTDILFIVDWSSSMGPRIQSSLEALNRFSSQFQASQQIRWGLIAGPIREVTQEDPRIYTERLLMVSNITSFGDFLQSFEDAPRVHTGGNEMLLDAVYLSLRNISANIVNNPAESVWSPGVSSSPVLVDFVVDWRPGAERIIIVFSDEVERSYMNPANTIYSVDDALAATNNLKLYSFAPGFYGWDEMAVRSGGLSFPLSSDSDEMYENLMTILDDVCRAPEEQGASFDVLKSSFRLASYTPISLDTCF
jgi:hypothetical protein